MKDSEFTLTFISHTHIKAKCLREIIKYEYTSYMYNVDRLS